MSYFSNLSVELQEDPELRHKLPQTRTQKPDQQQGNTAEYWQWCLEATLAAGTLASRTKLYLNYCNPTTRHNVSAVVQKYYSGSIGAVKDAREAAWDEFAKTIDMVNRWARQCGFRQVNPVSIANLLSEEGNRRKFRNHIRKHQERNDGPFPIDEIPARDFRHKKGE